MILLRSAIPRSPSPDEPPEPPRPGIPHPSRHSPGGRRARHTLLALLVLAFALAPTACGLGREGPSPDPSVEVLRVVTYNIRHGRGMDDVVDLERTADVLRRLEPDVVGLQEVDVGVQRSGAEDQPAVLGGLLGMEHAFGAFMDYQGGEYGMAILSRHPIVELRALELPQGNEPRVALMVEIETPHGRRVPVINVHFDWVSDDEYRFAQASELARTLEGLSAPFLLLGDFNDVPDSRTMELFRGVADEARKPADDRLTFSSTDPRREIDYIFAGPPGAGRFTEAQVIDERLASDHRPVVAVWEVGG